MLPQYIKEALIVSARYHAKAKVKQRLVEDWIEANYGENAVLNDSIRDVLIDFVETSNNPILAIKEIELILDWEY